MRGAPRAPQRPKENSDDHVITGGSIVCRRARAGPAGRRCRTDGGASQRRLIEWQLRLVEFGLVRFGIVGFGLVRFLRAIELGLLQFLVLVLRRVEQRACPEPDP